MEVDVACKLSHVQIHVEWVIGVVKQKYTYNAMSTSRAGLLVKRKSLHHLRERHSSFSEFTADQWKIWTLAYSGIVLKGQYLMIIYMYGFYLCEHAQFCVQEF